MLVPFKQRAFLGKVVVFAEHYCFRGGPKRKGWIGVRMKRLNVGFMLGCRGTMSRESRDPSYQPRQVPSRMCEEGVESIDVLETKEICRDNACSKTRLQYEKNG
jgi:hypothetical protein